MDTARTDDLPHGDASLAWKNLLTRFEPRQFGPVPELKSELYSKRFESLGRSPDLYYLELEQIRQKLSNLGEKSLTNDVLISQILINLPIEYENKKNHIQHLIDSGNKLTIIDVLGHLRENIVSLTKGREFDSRITRNNTVFFFNLFKGYCNRYSSLR